MRISDWSSDVCSSDLRLGVVSGPKIRAAWYSPRDGAVTPIGTFDNRGARRFDPPGETAPGNDWALVLDDAAAAFPPPGPTRSEERRAGQGCVSTCRSRGSTGTETKKTTKHKH